MDLFIHSIGIRSFDYSRTRKQEETKNNKKKT